MNDYEIKNPIVKAALTRMVDVFGETAKTISENDLFFAHRSSVEGRDKATLIPIKSEGKIDPKIYDMADFTERWMDKLTTDSNEKIRILEFLLKKELRNSIEQSKQEDLV